MSELPKWLVDWAQVLGAGLSLLALVLALHALNKSKRDLINERRQVHELDILRGIGELLEEPLTHDLPRLLRTQLLLLPGYDLPNVRLAVGISASLSEKGLRAMEARYAAKLARYPDGAEQHMRRFELIHNEGIDRTELDVALARRLRL